MSRAPWLPPCRQNSQCSARDILFPPEDGTQSYLSATFCWLFRMEIPVNKIGCRRADLTRIGVVVPASDISDGVELPVAIAAIHSRKGLPDFLPQALVFVRPIQHYFLIKVTALGYVQAVQQFLQPICVSQVVNHYGLFLVTQVVWIDALLFFRILSAFFRTSTSSCSRWRVFSSSMFSCRRAAHCFHQRGVFRPQ